MSMTIYYKGTLKKTDTILGFIETVNEKAKEYGWEIHEIDSKLQGIAISIPECDDLSFVFEAGKVNSFVKYIGIDSSVIENIFDTLWAIKPYFKRLTVFDDFGMWDQYIAKYSKDKFPTLRDLSETEKAELNADFYIPKNAGMFYDVDGIILINNMNFIIDTVPCETLMKMICKDISEELSQKITEKDLLNNIDSRIIRGSKAMEADIPALRFIIIVQDWMLKKLTNKNGNPLKLTNNMNETACFLSWLVLGFDWALGSKYRMLQRYVNLLFSQGYNYNNKEIFLRLLYSVLEFMGYYRPDDLILRTE